MPTLSATTWRDRSHRIISQRAGARHVYQGAMNFHGREKVSLRDKDHMEKGNRQCELKR